LLKITLNRNLRRTLLRGHPWVYREALSGSPALSSQSEAALCRVQDQKGDLAWGFYDPHSVIAFRLLSLEKSLPEDQFFENLFEKALKIRGGFDPKLTNAFRLFNGEGDLLPGLVCDLYGKVAVLQFDGRGPSEFWNRDLLISWLLKRTLCKTVVEKGRGKGSDSFCVLAGDAVPERVEILENGARFAIDLVRGQKTGFFLDQRDNRAYVREMSRGKRFLNLFSYTGGFSIYAGLGGAFKVRSIDISKGALELSQVSWELNGLNPGDHAFESRDVFDEIQGSAEKWDSVMVDPPSMASSESQKEAATRKYIEVFSAAAKKVNSGGDLYASSCSSHISFSDFFKIIEEALSGARRRGQILRVSGQGFDHPFPHVCPELRYLKFVHLVLN